MKAHYRYSWATGYWRRLAAILAVVMLAPAANAVTQQLSMQGRTDQQFCIGEAVSNAYIAAQTRAGQSDDQIVAGLLAARMHPVGDAMRAAVERNAMDVSVEDIRTSIYVGCMQSLGREP